MKIKRENLVKLITEQINFEFKFDRRLNESLNYIKEGGDTPSWWLNETKFPQWESNGGGNPKKWEVKQMLQHIKNVATMIKLSDAGKTPEGQEIMQLAKDMITVGVPAIVKNDRGALEKFDSMLKNAIKDYTNKKGYSKLATKLYPIVAFLRDKYGTGQGGGNDVPSGGAGGGDNDATPVTRVNEGKNES